MNKRSEKSLKTEKDFAENLLQRLNERKKSISNEICNYQKRIEKRKKDYVHYGKVGSAMHYVENAENSIEVLRIQEDCLDDVIYAVKSAINDISKD